ncbi:RagB/SusD family nutrient uptake outer membrane protein [Pedobacter sp. LMG 31464]|uniref:RagB/SusD family nutrient uptake outer membrane protein n=1 Tax=Pedobacter planticolens TaxID=2679964 RepID=A0A923ISU5_9SPHI|nr:RagB/SusD family nutrient uptake outer membrane protein [Pedobacter planticolens]MBB2143940.1 RagB/SusD family nutrient uptake outer membrane protein [Pedobacter planticolens]
MRKRTKTTGLVIVFLLALVFGCRKDFLEVKSNKKLVVPTTAKDLQALLDNTAVMNQQGDPSLGEQGAGDFVLADARWETISAASERNAYIWARDIFGSEPTSYDWNRPYQMIFYANTVIEGAQRLKDGADAAKLRGQALFYRAWAFHNLLQVFGNPYMLGASNDAAGIPLRLEADINLPSVRSTVAQGYAQVISDLTEASGLLPDLPLVKTRGSKAAAYALLARVYLQMGKYEQALDFAEKALTLQAVLLDYNSISPTAANPFKVLNDEVIYHSELVYASAFGSTRLNVVPELYNSYGADDLRKVLYFFNNAGTMAFKGSYTTLPFFFSGLAVDEMLLIKAECLTRMTKDTQALEVLNTLLVKRYKTGKFVPLVPSVNQSVLDLVLSERRKELVFRGIRWADLRRLNQDPNLQRELIRVIKGQTYRLPPGDPRYIMPLPNDVLRQSGMPNNNR